MKWLWWLCKRSASELFNLSVPDNPGSGSGGSGGSSLLCKVGIIVALLRTRNLTEPCRVQPCNSHPFQTTMIDLHHADRCCIQYLIATRVSMMPICIAKGSYGHGDRQTVDDEGEPWRPLWLAGG